MAPPTSNKRKSPEQEDKFVTGSALQAVIAHFGANMQNGFSALLQNSTQAMLGQVSEIVDAKIAPIQQSIESVNKEIEYLKQQSMLFNLKLA
eukprot:11189710-Karenia_brevis.AAC.1